MASLISYAVSLDANHGARPGEAETQVPSAALAVTSPSFPRLTWVVVRTGHRRRVFTWNTLGSMSLLHHQRVWQALDD
jgi:hypothetical protein